MSQYWKIMQPFGTFKCGSWQRVMLTRRNTRSKSHFIFKVRILCSKSREMFFFFLLSALCQFGVYMEATVLGSGVATLEPRQFNYYNFFQVADIKL